MRQPLKPLAGYALALALTSGYAFADDATTQDTRPQMREKMQERWKQLDTNHDGKISREEAQKGAPRLAEHFDQLDTNGDGQLAPEELRAARQARQGARAGAPKRDTGAGG